MKFGYTIIYVDDVAASVAFFKTAFGLNKRFEHESGDYAELETGETLLAFASHEVGNASLPNGFTKLTALDPPAGIEVALVTDDVRAAVNNALSAGAELIAQSQEKPWGQTVAYVKSPDGLLLELCSPVGN